MEDGGTVADENTVADDGTVADEGTVAVEDMVITHYPFVGALSASSLW